MDERPLFQLFERPAEWDAPPAPPGGPPPGPVTAPPPPVAQPPAPRPARVRAIAAGVVLVATSLAAVLAGGLYLSSTRHGAGTSAPTSCSWCATPSTTMIAVPVGTPTAGHTTPAPGSPPARLRTPAPVATARPVPAPPLSFWATELRGYGGEISAAAQGLSVCAPRMTSGCLDAVRRYNGAWEALQSYLQTEPLDSTTAQALNAELLQEGDTGRALYVAADTGNEPAAAPLVRRAQVLAITMTTTISTTR